MLNKTTKRAAAWGLVGGLVSLSLLLQNVHTRGLDLVRPIGAYQWGYDAGRVLVLALIAIDIVGMSILLFRLSSPEK